MLAGNQRHLALAFPRRGGDLIEPGALFSPADEACRHTAEARGQRDAPGPSGIAGPPLKLEGRQRLGEALQVQLADGLELVPTGAHHRPQQIGDKHLVAVGGRTQTSGLDHRRTKEVVGLTCGLPDANANTDRELLL